MYVRVLACVSQADGTQVEEDPNDMTPGALGWKNKTLKAVVEHMSSIHSEVRVICDQYFDRFRRRVYVTPKSFLTYIASFIKLYKVKHMEVIQLAGRIVEGLKKMLKAQVDHLRKYSYDRACNIFIVPRASHSISLCVRLAYLLLPF